MDATIVPVINSDVIFIQHSENDILAESTLYKYQVKLNQSTYNLLRLINNKNNISDIVQEYNVRHNSSIDTHIVYDIFYNKLSKYGIVENNDLTLTPRVRSRYLFLSFTLIKENTVDKISGFTKCFFNCKFNLVFPILLLILISILVANYSILTSSKNYFNSIYFGLFLLIMRLSNVWHELGHAAASKKYGIKPGDIGFGFYLLMPVFFTDVSRIWRIDRFKRIVVNLGGIYFDVILSLLLAILFIIFDFKGFILLSFCISFSIIYNLNPLVRYDGYWVLVDYLNINNLQRYSKMCVKELITGKTMPKSFKEYFIITYAIISSLYIVVILVTVLFYNNKIFTIMPMFIYKLVSLNVKLIDLSYSYIYSLFISSLIYVLLVRYVIKSNVLSKLLFKFSNAIFSY